MERLVSNWSNGKTLPENYIFPPETRPGNFEHLVNTPFSNTTLPIIDLTNLAQGGDPSTLVQPIMDAAQKFGFFQVINHGISKELINEVRNVFNEFFELPAEDKERFSTGVFDDNCVLFTSNVEYHNEELHFWRDALKHSCFPLENCMQDWPQNPTRYREVVGDYVVKVRELGARLLEVISQGLSVEKGYFENELSEQSILIYYRYPPCPDPSLTYGITKHNDPNLITILLQDDVPGLQVLIDGQWKFVDPIPGAFVVNLGNQMQIVSNGKLKSADHRVVTNRDKPRTSVCMFIGPTNECQVKAAKPFVTEQNPSLYKTVCYDEFFKTFKVACRLKSDVVLEKFLVDS